jgi:hypothetical protein
MPGLVPGIHVLIVSPQSEDVDGRDEPGHDEIELLLRRNLSRRRVEYGGRTSAFPRREASESCTKLPPKRGRGECRVLNAPAASRAK